MDIRQIISKNKLIIAIVIIAILIRIIAVYIYPTLWWDETVYANLGHDLSKHFFSYSLIPIDKWSDYIPGGDQPYSWPNIGFRAPLLPYSLSLFYSINLGFLVNFFMPIIGVLSIILVYYLGKTLFNKKVGILSSIFLTFLPLHVIYSGRILTEVYSTFFILLVFISFWKGYEEDNKKYKVLFGIFLALALLSRYTTLWIIPVFLIYFLVRDKSLKIIKDKYFWYAVLAFFLTLTPWFIYGLAYYNNPIGAFIHGFKASAYFGGIQPWHYFFDSWWEMFSIIGYIFILGVAYIIYKKDYVKRSIYLLIWWFIFFLGMAIYMPHKEERFLIPLIPSLVILSAYFVSTIKKYRKIFVLIITLILVLSIAYQFYQSYTISYSGNSLCFNEANVYLNSLKSSDPLIISDSSSTVYYYTKYQTRFYPNPWSIDSLRNSVQWNHDDNRTYILFTTFDHSLSVEDNIDIKKDLDNNFERVFICEKGDGLSAVYRWSSTLHLH